MRWQILTPTELIRHHWDARAGTFDDGPGHGITSGQQREAWLHLLAQLVVAPPNNPAPQATCPVGTVQYSGACVLVVALPPNAHIDASGKAWECNEGFYRQSDTCVSILPP